MNRYAQFLGSEGINVSLSSVDYNPYTQLNYLFKILIFSISLVSDYTLC